MSTGAQRSQDPWIELSGADNVRDLGGLPTRTGGRTKRRRLLRSGTLQELTPDSVATLVDDIGLRTVVDLRTPREAEREGSALTGVASIRIVSLPLRAGDAIRSDAVADAQEIDLVGHYLSYLSASPATIVAATREFGDAANLPAVFHCAAGKDRTGVLAAIVLDAVEVEPAAIVADYALTEERIGAIRDRLMRLETYQAMQAVIRRSGGGLSANAADLERFLEIVNERYGGGAGYLRAHGLTEAELDALRAALVEDQEEAL
jgi:protein-tyrosine phosphatase